MSHRMSAPLVGMLALFAAAVSNPTLAAELSAKEREAEAKAEASLPETTKAERAVVRAPGDRDARIRAARAQLEAGAEQSSHVEAAQQHVLAVLAESPGDIDALLLAGQTSLLKGDAMAAARYYRAATVSQSSNAAAFLGLGDALTRLGDESGASAAFARFRALQGMPPIATESNDKQ